MIRAGPLKVNMTARYPFDMSSMGRALDDESDRGYYSDDDDRPLSVDEILESLPRGPLRPRALGCHVPCPHKEYGPNRSGQTCKERHKRLTFTKAIRQRVFDEAGGMCVYQKPAPGKRCLGRFSSPYTGGGMQVDHLYPFAQGGLDDFPNFVAACESCNKSKGDRDVNTYCMADGKNMCTFKLPTPPKFPARMLVTDIATPQLILKHGETAAIMAFTSTCPACHALAPTFIRAAPKLKQYYDHVFAINISGLQAGGLPAAAVAKALGLHHDAFNAVPAFVRVSKHHIQKTPRSKPQREYCAVVLDAELPEDVATLLADFGVY